MERQAGPQGSGIAGRQQHAIVAKVVDSRPLPADRMEKRVEAAFRTKLACQQVMALQSGIIAWRIGQIDRAERKRRPVPGP